MKNPAMTIDLEYLDTLIQKDKEKGLFRCKREMFTNKDLFDLEMKHIFEGNWIYLAHESQLPKVNDYYTTKIGRQPVFITRNKDNQLNCFINACAHRGATLARFKREGYVPARDIVLALSGDAGARALLSKYSAEVVEIPVGDARRWCDVDTSDDLAVARALFKQS